MVKPFRKHKFNARPTVALGKKYASKREAEYAQHLFNQKELGLIEGWIEQIPIVLPGGIRYVVDFMVFHMHPTPHVQLVEVKGHPTPAWQMKVKLLREAYPWLFERLEIVK